MRVNRPSFNSGLNRQDGPSAFSFDQWTVEPPRDVPVKPGAGINNNGWVMPDYLTTPSLMNKPTTMNASLGKSRKAKSVIDVVLGEAVHGTHKQRYDDMVAIASVISNRARELGVTPEQVVSAPGEFSAYNKALPAGVNEYRELAHQALSSVEINGPVHNATFYATPNAAKNLPKGLTQVGATTGHQYFSDPKNRAIQTAVGYKTPQASLPTPASAPTSIAQSVNAGPAGRAYGDLVPSRSVPTTSIPTGFPDAPVSPTPAPAGDVGVPNSIGGMKMSAMSLAMGPGRPNAPSEDITNTIRSSVHDALGPGFGVTVTSGMESPLGIQVGSNRHKTGLAADFSIQDPSGRTLNAVDDRPAMESVAELASSRGVLGVGVGTNYMDGTHMHFDKVQPGAGQDNEWGNIGNAMADRLASARMGLTSTTGTVPTARPADIAGLQAMQDRREYERPSFSAPLGEVERTALPDISPSRTAFDAAAAGFAAPDSLAPDRPMPSGPVTGTAMSPSQLGALAGSMVGRPSLPPDRPMPSGPVNVSTAFAPDLSNLSISQPAYSLSAPNQIGTAPSLLSPAMMAPALSPPTEVADYNIASPIPGAPASPTVSPTPAESFPAAPEISTWDKVKYEAKPAVKNAMLGMKIAGPLGALAAPAIGMLGSKLGLGFDSLGPGFDNAVPDRTSTGFGLSGIMGAMGGPKGAQGFSLSNPGSSFTSLGNGMGLRRSDKYGWTEVVGPNGEVRGISYDKTPGGFFGGLFGGLSKSMKDKFGGGGSGISPAASAAIGKGAGGLY